MFRLVGTFFLASALVATGTLQAQRADKEKPAVDPQRLFRFADKNKDGKLSKDEFRQILRNSPRLKDNPERIDQLFKFLDKDGDESLTPEEFKLIGAARANAEEKRPFGKLFGKKKETETPAFKDAPATPEQINFFEKKIRPVLVDQCLKCHSAEKGKVRGGLALDSREGLRKGGDSGPAIIPGNPEKSLLIKAIHHVDDNLKMPAKKLSDAVIDDFVAWIRTGAADPRGNTSAVKSTTIDIEKGRSFWAFQSPKKSPAPTVKDTKWARGDIDRFLLSALDAKGMKPSADADRHTLVRRVTFDLTGLPPTPEEIENFMKDDSPRAFEKVVDRLLKSPRFGERWGRHWLDVARFAETSGKQVNLNYPHAWRYRDYVIASFNTDKPYDRFLTEQIAGDLLPAKDGKQKAEQIIATGFLAMGPKAHNERNRLQFEMDVVDEQIDTLSQSVLGMTVACARCHDHKFDPIPMKDYYALAGIFRSTTTLHGTTRILQNIHSASLVTLPKDCDLPAGREKLTSETRSRIEKQLENLTEERKQLTKQGDAFASPKGIRNRILTATLQGQLDLYEKDGTPKLLAMGVRDRFFPVNSPVFGRGEVDKPGDVVPRGFIQVVSRKTPTIKRGSGRRELAEWLTSKDNPLTARVMANRVWLHLFGRGIVPTVDNFGASGQKPTHPELLDYLAVTFRDNGWSVKKLIREIVLSRAYQQASTHDDRNFEIDPENVFVWRMSKRRLEAEPLRDAILSVSGQLNLTPPAGSLVARAGDGFSQGMQRFGPLDARHFHRAVYLPIIRDQSLEALTLFDFADPSVVVGERATTTVPTQSLYLLNNPFVIRQADTAAARLLEKSGSDRERIQHAYAVFYGRPASTREVEQVEEFLRDYGKQVGTGGFFQVRGKRVTWAAFCQALFASAEFQYRN